MIRILLVIAALSALGLVAGQNNLEVDKYLRKYGYIEDGLTGLASAADRQSGLLKFQRFVKLPLSGIADNATVNTMRRKRCACQDMMSKKMMQSNTARRPQNFNLGPRWTKTNLTWRITGYSSKLNRAMTRQEVIRAFRLWEDKTPLRFFESNAANVDIDISFQRGFHGDGTANSFDGRGSVLAHAFFPQTGDTHFDDDEEWVFNSNAGTDFFTVAAHEFGHALGLSHSEIQDALMAPFYQGYVPNFELHDDDVRGIQSLYGGPPVTGRTTTPRPMTTMRPPTQPPRTTPSTTTTIRTTVSTREAWCDGPFSAIFQDFDGTIYAFLEGQRFLIEINYRGIATLRRSRDVFSTFVPRKIDAAYAVASLRKVFLMTGKLVLQYDENKRFEDFIIMRATGSQMPVKPIAAIATSQNTIRVLGDSISWYMTVEGSVIPGSHVYTDRLYPGIPRVISGAMQGADDTVYFISGTRFYQYSNSGRQIRTGDFASEFMRNQCGR